MAETELLREEIKKFINIANPRTVMLVHAMLEADLDHDWWDDLPIGVQNSIDNALVESKNGQGISHEDVLKNYGQWFTR